MQTVLCEALSYMSVSGVATLGLSAIFYLLSKRQGEKAKQLDTVKTVAELRELEALLGATGSPTVVAATGRINSDKPLTCELTPSSEAVFREFWEDEHRWVKQPNGRDARETHNVRHDVSESQWYLEDGSRSRSDDNQPLRLLVADTRSAEGLKGALECKQAYYRETPATTLGAVAGTVADVVAGQLLLVRRDGSTKTERFLPLGAVVTVVGELARPPACESSGFSLMIRRPVSGPFYITKQTLGQLHDSLNSRARSLKYLAIAVGTVGTALVVHKLVSRLLATFHRWRCHKRHQAILRRAAQRRETGGEADSEDDEGVPPPNACAVCLERECESVFMPCGHMCCCFACGSRLKACPICRAKASCVRVYRA